jgi:hypothetical protein
VILDSEEGRSRLLSIDDSGFHEVDRDGMAGLAGEVGAMSPDLILVNPRALELAGSDVAAELNRRLRLRAGYAWERALGEHPAA